MTRFFQPYFPGTPEHDKFFGYAYGFYLVVESTQERHFISKVVDIKALDEVAEKVLNDTVGWDYWIDKSLGKDVEGKAAWVNLDQSWRFEV